MRRVAFFLVPLVGLGLTACGGSHRGDLGGIAASVECAPFARALTGVRLSGAAADWWQQATNRYTRSQQPEIGSVLVFRRSARLPRGHVAVVSRVVSRRQIMVTQANWQHHHVTADQPVIDISENGDWTAVRVWWPPLNQMGKTDYATFGFIRPDKPPNHDRLIAAMPTAIQTAQTAW